MSLSGARWLAGDRPELPSGPLYAARALGPWGGSAFWMEPSDPLLAALHDGASAPEGPLCNLVGLIQAWQDHPEWLDFLDPAAPNHTAKVLERSLYLHHWARWLPTAGRVLDLGAGTGRFTAWLLDQGLDVEVVDPDLRSLWRNLGHAAGRPGRLDVHWGTGETLDALGLAPVDTVLAPEVLCYTQDPDRVVANLAQALTDGGHLLCSVEARWGWAAALDAQAGTLPALLADGVVHQPGCMWVRTCEAETLRGWLEPHFEVLAMVPTHYVLSGPFELAAGDVDLDQLLALEAQLRTNPRTAHLNRAWMAVARKR